MKKVTDDKQSSMSESTKGFLLMACILVVLFIISKIYNNYVAETIQDSKYITVAQVTEIKLGAKNLSIEYKFKFNEKTYRSGLPIDDWPKTDLINKYFEIHVAKTNPDFNEIFLNREIIDSTIIKAAGFSNIEKIKRNQFQEP